jgi:hypothetical protein
MHGGNFMDDEQARLLQRRIADKSVVFLIGAGVSMQATGDVAASSCPGFMACGVDVACQPLDVAWADGMHARLAANDLDHRLEVEDELLGALGGR